MMKNQVEPASLTVENDWPAYGLETLGYCPICGERKRKKLYENLTDRLYNAPGHWTMYQCAGCQSGYLDPRPTEETIGLAYKNYITHEPEPDSSVTNAGFFKRLRVTIRNSYMNRKYGYKFEPSVPWGYYAMYLFPPPLRYEWDHYARHLPAPVSGRNRLLDVGCGNGAFLARAKQLGWEVQGLDFDNEAADVARRNGIEVWVGDYRQAPFAPESFDAITCHQVIEHVHDVNAFVLSLTSWLKKNGILWIGTPNFQSCSRRFFGKNWKFLHPPQHLSILNAKTLINISKKNNINAKIAQRGFYETHAAAESYAIAQGINNIRELYQRNKMKNIKITNILFEIISFLIPSLCCDIIVIGKKQK